MLASTALSDYDILMPLRYKSRGEANYYYVFNSSYQDKTIFRSADDYSKFVRRLRHLSGANSATRVIAYSLTMNSYHLILTETSKGAIANFIHRLSVSYAMYFNDRYNVKGKVFKGPYKEVPLVNTDKLLVKIAQLHKMPLLYHEKPESYLWTSYRAYLNNLSDWLDKEIVKTYFRSNNFTKALKTYTNSTPLS